MVSLRRIPWTTVALVAGGLFLAVLVAAYLWAMRQVVHAYYLAEYVPERLQASAAAPPPAARLGTVPVRRSELERGPGLALQLLLAQQGSERSLGELEFFLGSSWGATAVPRQVSFTPGQDEDVGFRFAAPALGLTRRYLVTDDEARFVQALREQLAKGLAVRVVVDQPAMEGRVEEEAFPRDLVLVGYDAAGFEVHELVCAPKAECSDGLPGAPGRQVPVARLLEAVDRQALRFKYPWRYSLLVLEPGAPGAPPPLEQTLARNARSLIGAKSSGPSTGAFAVRDLAQVVGKSGRGAFSGPLQRATKLASVLRAEDAVVVRALFPGDEKVEAGAKKLEEAAAAYLRAHESFGKKETFALTDALLAAASADEAAGRALLERAAPK